MREPPRQSPVEYDALAAMLSALAYPMRLELLGLLRFPHTLAEIRISPHKVEPGGNPERPAAKQTIANHLDKLLDAGLVRAEMIEQGGREVPRYSVNPQRFYATIEELRRLSVIYAGRGLGDDATGTLVQASPRERVRGPRLMLAHGVYEGKAFALDAKTSRPEGGWVIGRRPGLAVALDYDPFVSVENSVVTRDGDRWRVTDLPDSKNGTTVDWETLPRGGSRELENGSTIGVGRSLLLFLDR